MANFSSLAKLINQATKTKSEPEELLFMYNEAKKRLLTSRKPSPSYHPSSIGGCSRNLYFQLISADLDEDNYADAQLSEMGDSGTDRHERIQQVFAEMSKLGYPVVWTDLSAYLKDRDHLGTEVRAVHGMETLLYNSIFNLSFKCDGVIKLFETYRILEIKTEIEMKWIARNAPDPAHVSQGVAYSLALGIDEILFVYENRNTCAKKAYLINVSMDKKRALSDKIARIDSFLGTDKIPDKEESVSNCKYCSYKQQCVKW